MSNTKYDDGQLIHQSPWPFNVKNVHHGNLADLMFSSPNFTTEQHKQVFIDANDPSRFLTRFDVIDQSKRLAYVLQNKLGIKRGDVVCIWLYNEIYTPVLHYAILSIGAIVSPANIMYLPEELRHQLNVTQAKLIVTEPSHLEKAAEAGAKKSITLSQVIDLIKAETNKLDPIDLDGINTPAYYCFSSGTSGAAKGVISTHFNLASNLEQTQIVSKPVYDDINLFGGVLPMSHIFGLSVFVYSIPHFGSASVIFRSFDFKMLVQRIYELKISFLHIVPPLAVLFAKAELPYSVSSLKRMLSGAAPLGESLSRAVTDRLGCPIYQAYGLTETSPMSHFFTYDLDLYDKATVGWLVPGMEAKLLDPEGKVINEYGTPGELVLKGPNVMKGYLNNPTATEAAFNDKEHQWFRTGDVVTVSRQGQFQIVDRVKELIKSKGHQVAPAELEEVLLRHPLVTDSAVTGISVPEEGTEWPRAYVTLAAGPGTDREKSAQVLEWFNKQVAKHKRLWGGIVVIPAIPKSPSGKILRRVLRERKDKDEEIVFMNKQNL